LDELQLELITYFYVIVIIIEIFCSCVIVIYKKNWPNYNFMYFHQFDRVWKNAWTKSLLH